MKRLLGSVTLAIFVLSLVAPLAASRPAAEDCPLAPATEVPALVAAMEHQADDCAHPGLGSCLSALGCLTATPAIGAADGGLVAPPSLFVISPPLSQHAGDSLGAGPPTPPPNLI